MAQSRAETRSKYSLPIPRNVKVVICKAPLHMKHEDMRHCIDFGLPEGTPILAARAGVVIECEGKYQKAYYKPTARNLNKANYVLIRHADGEETMYVHLQHRSLKVQEGQKVKRGQVIGLSGQTGFAWYPHLHFGVYNKDAENIPATFR